MMKTPTFQLIYQKEADESRPLDGIFEFMLQKSDVIQTNEVCVTESSIYPENDIGEVLKSAKNLVYRKNETVWASNGKVNEYFEIYFPYHAVELSNYTFMASANDDDIPRTWSVLCLDNDKEVELAQEIDNQKLCNGIHGVGLSYHCKIYDKQIFGTANQKICRRIRFKLTGKNSSDKFHFVLSGVEVFGKLFHLITFSCKTSSVDIKLSYFIVLFNLVE